jgi:hypothetical protein
MLGFRPQHLGHFRPMEKTMAQTTNGETNHLPTKTPQRHPGWFVPFRNPFQTLRELDEACLTVGSASGWKSQGRMPWWVELVLQRHERPTSIKAAVRFINEHLQKHSDHIAEIGDGDHGEQTLQIVQIIA